MSPSLREERKVRTSASIAAAALELFATRGYAAVTVAEVAAAARVGERTLYRYFADKEDLLFAEDEGWRASLRAAIEQQPAGEPPFTVLRGASATVARALEDRREEVRRRAEVIASAPALAARERAKHAAWEEVLAEGLRERGVAAGEARLLGRIAVACYDEALTRWLAQDGPQRTLGAELDAAFAELGASTARD
ncbi:MAG TPA: TetR/AcrR family transcriptional regulator [Solirubrobacteraceae bacterium]|nr:TetR/AcrR family transcriptional regulator [Solirubrobacteraceae bacterium]